MQCGPTAGVQKEVSAVMIFVSVCKQVCVFVEILFFKYTCFFMTINMYIRLHVKNCVNEKERGRHHDKCEDHESGH